MLKIFVCAILLTATVLGLPVSAQPLEKLAQKGNAGAQFELALAYEYGRDGVVQNDLQALMWYKKAAIQNNAEAMLALGWLVLKCGCDSSLTTHEQTLSTAVNWLEKSISLGAGDPKNIEGVKALTPEALSALRSDYRIRKNEDVLDCDVGNTLPCSLDAQRQALYNIKGFAEAGTPRAQYVWAVFQFHPLRLKALGLKANTSMAMDYLKSAADSDITEAMALIAKQYEYGGVVEKNIPEAIKWYERILTTYRKWNTTDRVVSGGDDSLATCKLHFLRGDPAPKHFDCEPYRNY